MPTLRLNSFGPAVELWQRIAGVEVTGYFATITDAATRVYQHRHGLEEDGVVGPNTWGSAP